jgi:D-3-phosphoglycerate dehydrogenase
MERYTVFVAEKLDALAVDILHREAEVIVELNLTPDQLIQRLNETQADALIVRSGTKVTRTIIEACPLLKVVGRAGAGVDNIDLAAATERGIIAVNAPTGNSVAAAEHAIALMFALARNVPQADAAMRRGEWNRHVYTGKAVSGKTLGIVALGRVGSEVAKRAKGLGMEVIGFDPYFPAERAAALGIELVGLDEIWEKSDFITLHAPLTDDTRAIINRDTIAKMKKGVYIINDARGG